MPDKLSFSGLLPAGFHIKTLEEVKILCVENFPSSTTRPAIFNSFVENFIEPIRKMGFMCDIWVDGSFITEKEDPEDVDVVIEFDVNKPHQMEKFYYIKAAMCNPEFKHDCLCDVYAVATNNQPNVAYWMGQFGFNRDRSPKGLAVIQINGGK